MFTAWNALRSFHPLDRLLDDVMNDVTGTALGTANSHTAFTPAIDVRANDDEVVFVCDVPGLKHDDLEITLEEGVLSIKGQRRYEGNDKDRVWLGRSYGAFARSFTLPEYVDADRMTADLADGVLTIRVPKEPKAKPRKIQIGGSASPQLNENNPEKK